MDKLGNGVLVPLSPARGFRRWGWKGMDMSRLPTPAQADLWFDGRGNPPIQVLEGLSRLDAMASEMLPVSEILPRLNKASGSEAQRLSLSLFGLDQTSAPDRLRKAIARAWRVNERYADAYLDRFEGAQLIQRDALDTIEAMDELLERLRRMAGIVDRWTYGGHPATTGELIDEARASLNDQVDRIIGWADHQIAARKRNTADSGSDEPSPMVGIDGPMLDFSVESWLSALRTEAPGGERWIAAAGTAEIALEEQITYLELVEATVANVGASKHLKRRRRQLVKVRSAIERHEGSGETYFPERTKPRPDRFLWLRLAEIYTVNFGRAAPLHFTDRAENKSGQRAPDAAFRDFLVAVLYSVNWDHPEQASPADALRQVRTYVPDGGFQRGLEDLANPTTPIDYASLQSNALLVDMNAFKKSEL